MKNPPLPPHRSGRCDVRSSESLDDRTPADLRTLAIQALEASPVFRGRTALGTIRIESDGGTLLLAGQVPSYYLKQQLQEVLRRVNGVTKIRNLVEVTESSGFLDAD